MNVEDIMTTNVRTVSSDKKLGEVVSLMCIYRYSAASRWSMTVN
jgi:predicted transcriptional regulator